MNPFVPLRFVRGPHLQALLANTALRRVRVRATAAEMLAHSQDQIVDCGDGVRLLLHHTPPKPRALGRVVALIHGWEGSAMSTYMLSIAAHLWNAGYRVIRINLRDHGESHHLNEGLFHSCRLAEAIGAVRWVQTAFPDEALMLGGYSLGGNFSLRIAAAANESTLRIERVVAICPVLDPAQTMQALDLGFSAYRIYFIRRWRRSLQRKKRAFPILYDFSNLERFNTLHEMTDYFVTNYTEFPDLRTYLQGYALTGERLTDLDVPSKILLAEDDPVVPIRGLDEISTPKSLSIEISRFGGHCGFVSNLGSPSWLDDYFLNAFDVTRGNHSQAV